MTDNVSAVEEIIRCLSFEVVAIPDNSQKIVPSSTTKATPLNIKVKVKKKHESGLQHGVLATPIKGPDEAPQRIRLVSSDQTIMSFNAVMEDIEYDKSRAQKPNLQSVDNHPQSQGTLRNKLTLSKEKEFSNKNKDIFGRCKPGGCLDPPFGEDKYSYKPSKQQLKAEIQDASERKRTSSMFSNKLFKKINKTKTSKVDVKKDHNQSSNQSVTSCLYQTGSLQTSYSNFLITYPSPLKVSDDKVIQEREKSPRSSARTNSIESDNGSLYIIPKKIRASLEKEEAQRKSEGDDKNLNISEKLENTDDVNKLDDDKEIYNSALNHLDEGGAKYDMRDNATKGVKPGLFAAEVTAATVGIAATLRSDLKDNSETTSVTLVDKLSDNDNKDLKVDDNKTNKTISNDNINSKYLTTEQHQVEVNKTNYEEKNILRTEPKVQEYRSDKQADSTLESKQDDTRDNSTKEVKTGLIAAGVTAATVGIVPTLLSDLKDNNETISESLVDKLSDNDNKTNNTISNHNSNIQYLNTEQHKEVNKTNYEEKNIIRTEPKVEEYGSYKQTDSTSESKLEDSGDNCTKEVKTGLDAAGFADGIAATLRSDLKDNNETISVPLDDKLTDNDSEDLKVDDNNINKMISNDNIDAKFLNTDQYQVEVHKTNYEEKNMLRTEPNVEEYGSDKQTDRTTESKQDNARDNSTKEVKTGLIAAGVTAATVGIVPIVLSDLKDNNKTSDSLLDKLPDSDKVDDSETNRVISNDEMKINETATRNITDDKAEHGGDSYDVDRLSSNTTDYKDWDVKKHEDLGKKDSEIHSNKDLSKDAQIGVTEAIMGDTNILINEAEDFDTDELVFIDRANINKMLSDELNDNRDSVILSSLDISNNIDKQGSKSDIVKEITNLKANIFTDPSNKDDRRLNSELQPTSPSDTNNVEYDKDNKFISSIRDQVSDTMSNKNEEDILSVYNRHIDLQNMLIKGKEFYEPEGTYGNGKTQSELSEYAFDYKDLNKSENIINNDEQNITNDVGKKDVSSDRLGHNNDLSEHLSKHHQLQPGSSETVSLKEIKIKKATDGDKQKKRKESVEQFKIKIDLGFHTYTNENNELILKTFDSRNPPSRNHGDSVIVANCDLKDPFELNVPFGAEQHLLIQIKDNDNLIRTDNENLTNLPSTAKSSKNSLIGKKHETKLHKINEKMNSTVKNATKAVKLINKDIVKAQMKDIYGTYENELVPLKRSLTRLKQDVDVLILHQKAIRNNLINKRLKIKGNRKCGCVMKIM